MKARKHLTFSEVNRLIAATQGSRNEARDRCLVLLMFRHGLRVSEACGLTLSQVDLDSRVLHLQRLKKGLSTCIEIVLRLSQLYRLSIHNSII